MLGGSLFCKCNGLLLICLILVVLLGIFTSDTAGNKNKYNNVFTPSLCLKYVTNFIFSRFDGSFSFASALPRGGFTLVKVTKIVDKIVRTPLAKMFLVTRLANKCSLFLPLVVISIDSCLAVVIFRPRDVCSVHLTGGKRLLARRGSGTMLALVGIRGIIRASFIDIHPRVSLNRLIGTVSASRHGVFPIASGSKNLLNIILLSSVEGVVFHRRLCRHFAIDGLVASIPTHLCSASDVRRIVRAFSSAGT